MAVGSCLVEVVRDRIGWKQVFHEDNTMTRHTHPLVSISIPTYNRANSYLKHALRSAVCQTYQNIEIIVSDNNSPDNTESVVREFDDPRIRYYRQKENIGPIKNRHFCLEQARGEYFVLLLDDDVIDGDFVSACMDAVENYGEPGIVLTGARQIDSAGNILSASHNRADGCSTADFILGWFDGKVPLYLCSTLFNTQRLRQHGGLHSETNRYDDVVAYVQLAAKYGRVDIFDIKASYRRHDGSIGSGAQISTWCEDSRYLLGVMCDAVPEHAARIRARGMTYFNLRNYNRAAEIRSPVDRYLSYLTVYRTFHYSYSPLRYMSVRTMSPIWRFVKRKIGSL